MTQSPLARHVAANAHLVTALDVTFDPAFDRKTGAKRVFELPIGRRATLQLPRERESSLG